MPTLPPSFVTHARPMENKLVHLRYAKLRRLLRYGSVSVISTATSLTVLGLLVGLFAFPAIWANVIAVALGTIPSFLLNKRWVWSWRGRPSLLGQVLPYSLLSFAGLLASTLSVHVASVMTATAGRLSHTAAVEIANFGSYGGLWLFQFALCERILFKKRGPAPTSAGIEKASVGA